MPLSIKDDQTDELARRLAGLTGETITTAVREALRERLERESRRRGKGRQAGRLLEIGRRCAAPPFTIYFGFLQSFSEARLPANIGVW